MSSYIDDLNYIIDKARIGLTGINLLKTSDLYKEIIDEDIVDKLAKGFNNLSEKNFDNIENLRNSIAKDDLAFMSQVDNIIYKLMNNENANDIKAEITSNASMFPSTANSMHIIWQHKYNINTVFDEPIDHLYHYPSDLESFEQVNYALNKANCSASLYNISQNIIDEINLANISNDKQTHLDLAKNNKNQFIDMYNLYNQGFSKESFVDDFITEATDNKINELFDKVSLAGEIQHSLMSDSNAAT